MTSAADKARTPALIGTVAAAGLAGGMALRSRMQPKRGMIPRTPQAAKTLRAVADEMGHVGRQIGKAGFRLGVGDVDMEVKRGKNGSQERQSPIEALLTALTSRRVKR